MNDYKMDFVLKNSLFCIIFIIIATIGITQVIMPKIHTYKAQLADNRHTELIYNQTNADFMTLSAQVYNFIADNKESFDRLYTQTPDEAELQGYLQEYFNSVSVKQTSQILRDDILQTRYQVVGFMSGNLQLQECMKQINELPYVIQISSPLSVQEDHASKSLKVSLYFEILQSLYKPHSLVLQEGLEYRK